MQSGILEERKRLNALADTGLLYAANEYDRERYTELKEIAFSLLHKVSDHPVADLKAPFPLVQDYPTAKVDIRGMVLSPDQKILLVQEGIDKKWSLPGGWADVGYSPKETIIKEFREETGLEVLPQQLVAVFDKKMHPHPPQAFYVYKFVFYCTALTHQVHKGFDVLDVQYFSIDALPDLSEDRILKSQLETIFQKILSADATAYVD